MNERCRTKNSLAARPHYFRADARNVLEPPGNFVAGEPRHQLFLDRPNWAMQLSQLFGQQEDHLGRDQWDLDDDPAEKPFRKPERMLKALITGCRLDYTPTQIIAWRGHGVPVPLRAGKVRCGK